MTISKKNEFFILGSSAILITLFLFFIDQSNYNFNWIEEPFVFVIFEIYAIPIFLGQLFIYKVFPKNSRSTKKIILSIFGGSIIGITATVSILLSEILT